MEEEHCWTYWDWPIPSSAEVEVVQPSCPWARRSLLGWGWRGRCCSRRFGSLTRCRSRGGGPSCCPHLDEGWSSRLPQSDSSRGLVPLHRSLGLLVDEGMERPILLELVRPAVELQSRCECFSQLIEGFTRVNVGTRLVSRLPLPTSKSNPNR